MNQTNQLQGESQHYNPSFKAKQFESCTKRQRYKTLSLSTANNITELKNDGEK